MPTLQEPGQDCNPHTTRPHVCQPLVRVFFECFRRFAGAAHGGAVPK